MPCLQEIAVTKFLEIDFKTDVLDNKLEFVDKQLLILCFSLLLYSGKIQSTIFSYETQ